MDTVSHPRRPSRLAGSELEAHPDARHADCIVWCAVPDAPADGTGPQAEGVPAVRVDGDRVRLVGIPFFPYHLALGDEVQVHERAGALYLVEVAVAAPELTVRVFDPAMAATDPDAALSDPGSDEPFWRILRALSAHGIWFERYTTSYAALSIPPQEWQYVEPFLDLKARVEGLQWELATPLRAAAA